MWKQRYPHRAVGKLVAPVFAVVCLVGGALVAKLVPGTPNFLINALLWAIVGYGAAFMVYSSEAPRRPLSLRQAVVADGVVSGITLGFAAMILDLIVATNVGPGGAELDFLSGMGKVLLAAFLCALAGAGVGAGLVAALPEERLYRAPAPGTGRNRNRRNKNQRRRR